MSLSLDEFLTRFLLHLLPKPAQPEPNRAQIPKVGAVRKLRLTPMDIDREAHPGKYLARSIQNPVT
jgi:hypothetical protein